MVNIYKEFIKNPLTIWMNLLIKKLILEHKYKKNQLKIGYLSRCINCKFGIYNTILDHVLLENVKLGDFTYISSNTTMLETIIGKYCSVGPSVNSGLGMHPTKYYVSSHPIFYSTRKQAQISFADKNYFDEYEKIIIGNDVWIGANVFIVNGVKIGDGAIISAGAVVTKDVPDYAILGGIPAKIIRYRFNDDQIILLKKYKWWDKDMEWLKQNYKLFHNIDQFQYIINKPNS